MKIRVKFNGEGTASVRAEELEELIKSGRIISFCRNDEEWIRIGVDPVRGMGGRYRGPERRGNVLFM
jgi:hypothetical protein